MSERRHRRLPHSVIAGPTEWPFGAGGDLTVLTGTTTTLTAGLTYDYRNITIQAGGTLTFSGGDLSTPTILGFSGAFDLSGIINVRDGRNEGGTWNNTAPDGESIYYTIVQSAGANGGDSGFATDTWAAGSAEGGGGGGGGNSGAAAGDTSGNGGIGGSGLPIIYSGGTGGFIYEGTGFDGQLTSGNVNNVIGAGGGGGAKARHGSAIYIKGGPASSTSGTGTINCSGLDGGNAGNGAQATNIKISGTRNAFGGGGGGGGAGGSGGKVKAIFKTSAPSWTYTISGGAGGNGGIGGIGVSTGFTADGLSGMSGTIGSVGSTDISTY